MTEKKPAISTLIFDAGDILVHRKKDTDLLSWKKILNEFNKKNVRIGDQEDLFKVYFTKLREFGSEKISTDVEVTLDFDDKNRIDLRLPVDLLETYEIEKWWLNPAPGLKEFITKLRSINLRIGILTDSVLTSDKIREVLRDISPMVDSIVSSRDTGKQKPQKEMYAKILMDFRISDKKKALFIGHDQEELRGAKHIGMRVLGVEESTCLSRLFNLILEKVKIQFPCR